MNIERLKYFEKVMRKFDSCDMASYQEPKSGKLVKSPEELHLCGNTACFAGRVAIDPLFISAGGRVSSIGAPVFNDKYESDAVALFFKLPSELAGKLVYGDREGLGYGEHSNFYGKLWKEVTGPDVADKLQAIINGEIE